MYDAYLLGIDPNSFKIKIAEKIKNEYGDLEGAILKERRDRKVPNPEGMHKRWEEFKRNEM